MLVKILGSGCSTCKNLENKVRDVIIKNNIDAEVTKITEIQDILAYSIMRTPGLVVNEVVKSSGMIPKDEQILEWLREAQS
jgi:small redox-active disulfide protein 2